jgi:hypothetical protein
MAADRVEYLLRLRPLPSGIPAEIRLRRGLKYLLRSCELACVEVRELKGEERAAGPAGGPPSPPPEEEFW